MAEMVGKNDSDFQKVFLHKKRFYLKSVKNTANKSNNEIGTFSSLRLPRLRSVKEKMREKDNFKRARF